MPVSLVQLCDENGNESWFHLSVGRENWILREFGEGYPQIATGTQAQGFMPPQGRRVLQSVRLGNALHIAGGVPNPGIRDDEALPLWNDITDALDNNAALPQDLEDEPNGFDAANVYEGNSRVSRVLPVFRWLCQHAGSNWPSQLLALTTGDGTPPAPGPLIACAFEPESRVDASPRRLAWMIRNAHRLTPSNPRRWHEYRARVIDNPHRDEALSILAMGIRDGIADRRLLLEGATCCDCLIECERILIWVEGKRFDWLTPSTTWDVTRDQLARDLDAAWILASQKKKDFLVVICHEHPLKHHEEMLLNGYRAATWYGGLPHLSKEERRLLGERIRTISWSSITNYWADLRNVDELRDLVGGGV
jgi:hypothetical protein